VWIERCANTRKISEKCMISSLIRRSIYAKFSGDLESSNIVVYFSCKIKKPVVGRMPTAGFSLITNKL